MIDENKCRVVDGAYCVCELLLHCDDCPVSKSYNDSANTSTIISDKGEMK